MTGFSQELSRITKNFKDLGNITLNGITTLFNLGANGTKFLQVALIGCYWLLAACIQVGFVPFVPKFVEQVISVPKFVEWVGSRMIELFDPTKYSLAKILIDLGKNFSYPILNMATKIPVLGELFTKAMLPWTVSGVIGVLFVSNFCQVLNEQRKVVRQQFHHLKQHVAENPEDLGAKGQLAGAENSLLGYLGFYLSTVARTGFADANKAFSMRLILAVGASSCVFLIGCLCGIPPVIVLSGAVKLSWAGWVLPYGAIGVLGAAHNGYTSIYETLWPIDHNKVRAEKAELEKQQVRLEEQRLDATGGRGCRLTDEPNLGQFTNNQHADNPQISAAQKEAERLEKRRLVLEALYSRCPVPGKTPQEAAQEALQPRSVPVVMSQVTPSVEASRVGIGRQPDSTATANKANNKPSFG